MGRRAPPKNSDDRISRINEHINFRREAEKSNARKDETKVICIKCRKTFMLPFRPRKPEVYCDACFKKKKNKT